jgi:glycosyltransferase involved in cell wall biosynthesis
MDLSDWPIRLPETLPCASVLSVPGLKLIPKTIERAVMGRNEIILATAGDDPNTVADKIPKDNFIEMDLAVNPDTFKPLKSDELDRTNRCDILLVADIADLDCRKYGVTQQSHQTLWRHLVSQVTRTPLRFSANDAESLLRRAGRETQIELDDQELFDEFANLLRRRLLPSAGALSIARTLVSAGYVVGIYGSGWENHNDLAARIVSASKDLPELNRLLNSADRVLYLNYETNWRPIVLSALCAGKPVIVQTLAGDSAIERAPIREAMVQLSSERTLVEQIEDIRRRRQQLEKSAMRAREYLIEHHSFEKIAQTILNRFGQSD